MRARVAGTKGIGSVAAAFLIWLPLGSFPAFSQTPDMKTWELLQAGAHQHDANARAAAVRALGLVQGDPRASQLAEEALKDKKTAVRIAAATSLGQLGGGQAIPALKVALMDNDSRVSFAAADSLVTLGDPSGYDLYYEVLTGERKIHEGLVTEKMRLIADPKERNLMALGLAAGFAPYAGYGWMMWRELSKDYVSPVRERALTRLADDRDPRIGTALVKATFDKHERVRVAALSAVARYEDPSLIPAIVPHLNDKKAAVRYMAAAAILRLSALASTGCPPGGCRTPTGP